MNPSFEENAQQAAKKEVQNTYPDVYRADDSLRNHAYAVAQQQIENTSEQVREKPFSVQHYAEAYITAYRHAVEERDAQQ